MGTAFQKISRIISNKLWGCLADVTSDVAKYDEYVDLRHSTTNLREYWTDAEIDAFADKVNDCFNLEIIISDRDRMVDITNYIYKKFRTNMKGDIESP